MQTQNKMSIQTVDQSDITLGHANNNRSKTVPLIINGCSVFMSYAPKGTDEAINAVKEILLSAYRAKINIC